MNCVILLLLQLSLSPLSSLSLSLRPYSIPLMNCGKSLARCGESIVTFCDESPMRSNLWGGGLSLAGASVRNAGDCLAGAGAAAKNKFGRELVIEEIREAAVCLGEAESVVRTHKDAPPKLPVGEIAEELKAMAGEVEKLAIIALGDGGVDGWVGGLQKCGDICERIGVELESTELSQAAQFFKETSQLFGVTVTVAVGEGGGGVR